MELDALSFRMWVTNQFYHSMAFLVQFAIELEIKLNMRLRVLLKLQELLFHGRNLLESSLMSSKLSLKPEL
jgi:hypothetical protein